MLPYLIALQIELTCAERNLLHTNNRGSLTNMRNIIPNNYLHVYCRTSH